MAKKKESEFKGKLYREIRERFPGAEVLPNDASYLQGVPDATVFFPNGQYMMLESKKTTNAKKQKNQDHYVYASSFSKNAMFAQPENKEEVLSELERRYHLK